MSNHSGGIAFAAYNEIIESQNYRNAREVFYASADKPAGPYHGPFASWISST